MLCLTVSSVAVVCSLYDVLQCLILQYKLQTNDIAYSDIVQTICNTFLHHFDCYKTSILLGIQLEPISHSYSDSSPIHSSGEEIISTRNGTGMTYNIENEGECCHKITSLSVILIYQQLVMMIAVLEVHHRDTCLYKPTCSNQRCVFSKIVM